MIVLTAGNLFCNCPGTYPINKRASFCSFVTWRVPELLACNYDCQEMNHGAFPCVRRSQPLNREIWAGFSEVHPWRLHLGTLARNDSGVCAVLVCMFFEQTCVLMGHSLLFRAKKEKHFPRARWICDNNFRGNNFCHRVLTSILLSRPSAPNISILDFLIIRLFRILCQRLRKHLKDL